MHAGSVVQHDQPDDLWLRPANEWVARFLGLNNIPHRNGQTVLIRPEAIQLTPGSGAVVVRAERRGAAVHLRVRLSDGEELEAVTTHTEHPRPGDNVDLSIDPTGVVRL